uniref:DUF5641 domain-containing protein n=1 Tax=Glossina austeni TaxID=7395 RepID=A0A1A9V3L0_GLOAU
MFINNLTYWPQTAHRRLKPSLQIIKVQLNTQHETSNCKRKRQFVFRKSDCKQEQIETASVWSLDRDSPPEDSDNCHDNNTNNKTSCLFLHHLLIIVIFSKIRKHPQLLQPSLHNIVDCARAYDTAIVICAALNQIAMLPRIEACLNSKPLRSMSGDSADVISLPAERWAYPIHDSVTPMDGLAPRRNIEVGDMVVVRNATLPTYWQLRHLLRTHHDGHDNKLCVVDE